MRRIIMSFAALVAGGVAMAGATAGENAQDRTARDATAFAKATAGLTPGAPVDCIDTRRGTLSTSAIGDRLIYKANRKLLYVNDTSGGCEGIAHGDALVTRQYTSRLCRGDIAQTVNFLSRSNTGSCALGSFTPYIAR